LVSKAVAIRDEPSEVTSTLKRDLEADTCSPIQRMDPIAAFGNASMHEGGKTRSLDP
jgi:hypothetical protein